MHWMWKLYEIQISVSMNKVLLEHSNTHLFTYGVWLLLCSPVELDGNNRACVAHAA